MRDLMNLIVRARSRLENRSAADVRVEESKSRNMAITFMPQHEEAQKTIE